MSIPVNAVNYEKDKKVKVVRYIKKKLEQDYILKKFKWKDDGKVYFLCNNHEMESVTKKMKIIRYGKEVVISHTFQAPTGKGLRAEAEDAVRSSSGKSGNSREYQQHIHNVSNIFLTLLKLTMMKKVTN